MSAIHRVSVKCDHLGCEAVVEGRDIASARRAARQEGWRVGVKKGASFRDYCPDHRDNRSFYG